MAKYKEPRPALPANLRRAVEVESGHACAVNRCGEHTYLEIHHINQNREDNRIENLILLCDKHHKMAHSGVIDKKALNEYKRLLKGAYISDLMERLRRLEELTAQGDKLASEVPTAHTLEASQDPDLPTKTTAGRPQLMYLTLEQLALARFERENNLLLERHARITKGTAFLELDALRQDDDLSEDVIVEVRWLRKRYLDGPVWVRQVEAVTETYEFITGRKARGVLLFVVPKQNMKTLADLPLTAAELEKLERKPEIFIYTYAELGFDPGAVSSELFTSNVKTSDVSN